MKSSLLPIALGLSLLSGAAIATPTQPYLETIGVGEVQATPDMADLNIAINITRKSAKEAKDASDSAIAALLTRLKSMEIERADVQASNISLNPQYSYPKDGQPVLQGFRANRNVVVTVRDLAKLNAVLDGAIADGINKINGINLRSSRQEELKIHARSRAIENAISKANQVAQGFNQKVAGVWSIEYNDVNQPPMMLRMSAESAKMGANMGYVDTKIKVTDQVNVTFTLNGSDVVFRHTPMPITTK